MTDVIAIIGAGPGMGMALARRFAAEGFSVGAVSRTVPDPDPLAQLDVPVLRRCADAAEPEELDKALHAIAAVLGPITVLAHNTSSFTAGPTSSIDPAALEHDLRVGVVSGLVAARAVLPAMQAAGRGTLLFTGGGSALNATSGMGTLSMAKSGLRNLALALADEFNQAGVIHAATVTINALIGKTPDVHPDRIAEAFWQLHSEPRGSWSAEVAFPR